MQESPKKGIGISIAAGIDMQSCYRGCNAAGSARPSGNCMALGKQG